jgi:23S rRNA pseudouridine955/2504/2580 synthase
MVSMSDEAGLRGAATLVVEEDAAGQRIDNWLLKRLKGWPRSQIYRLLRSGQVRVNSGRRRPDYRLSAGDRVRLPPQAQPTGEHGAAPVPATLKQRLAGTVIEEHDGFIVLDKPAGLAVHGGSGISFGVIEILRASRPEETALELVHRLDRDTSGCLLIAKRRSVLKSLHEQFRDGTIEKRYLALVMGRWQRGRDTVSLPLEVTHRTGGERYVRVADTGKEATTSFRLVEDYGRASLLEVMPHSGRTHQIRVHAQALGHPVVGDPRYGDSDFNFDMEKLGLRRLFLHAHMLSFRHPVTGEPCSVSAPLPPELAAVVDRLGPVRRGPGRERKP